MIRTITESLKTARQKYSDKIDQTAFEQLSASDPSKTFKYIEKMCELYLKGISIEKLKTTMHEYEQYYTFIEDKDITHKNFNQILADICIAKIDSQNSNRNLKSIEKQRCRIYYENGISIYEINSFYDAYKKGIGTHWCISYSENWYNIHTMHEKFLIVHNDNLPFENPNSRLCIDIFVNDIMNTFSIFNKDNYEYIEYSTEYSECVKQLGNSYEFIKQYVANL